NAGEAQRGHAGSVSSRRPIGGGRRGGRSRLALAAAPQPAASLAGEAPAVRTQLAVGVREKGQAVAYPSRILPNPAFWRTQPGAAVMADVYHTAWVMRTRRYAAN